MGSLGMSRDMFDIGFIGGIINLIKCVIYQ